MQLKHPARGFGLMHIKARINELLLVRLRYVRETQYGHRTAWMRMILFAVHYALETTHAR